MYSHTIPRPGDDITQSSTNHHPVSPFLRRSNHALMDKRPSKRQRKALYVNSRHVASQHSTLKVVQPATQSVNQSPQPDESLNEILKLEPIDIETSLEARSSPDLQVLEDIMEVDVQSTADSSASYETISTTSVSSKANVSTYSNEDAFTQSFNTMVSIDNKAPIVIKESSPTQANTHPNHGVTTTSHGQSMRGPMNKHGVQTRSVLQVKSWRTILKYIHKQLQNHELFGDELVFTRENPDFLTLLKQIDQWKNWVTYQEEQGTNLSSNIKDILVNNAKVIDQESKKLAVQIVDNFDQRFRNQRYFGPRG